MKRPEAARSGLGPFWPLPLSGHPCRSFGWRGGGGNEINSVRCELIEPLPISHYAKKSSARARHRAITCHRSRARPEPRRERRRHVVQRRSAMAAMFQRRVLHSEPAAPRGTERIQTLHRATGQMLHRPSRPAKSVWTSSAKGKNERRQVPPFKLSKGPRNWRNCAPERLVCQQKTHTISWGSVPQRRSAAPKSGFADEPSSDFWGVLWSLQGPVWLAARPLSSVLPLLPAALLLRRSVPCSIVPGRRGRTSSWACCSTAADRGCTGV